MKKSLALLKLLKTGISLFIDIAMFIYLVITSALTSVAEVVNGTVTFALVIAWFVWAAAVILSVLIVKNFKKTERESELKLQIIYACALMLVGVFVLVDVNVLVIALFALMLVEYFVRDRLGEFDAPISGGAEPPAEQPQGIAAEEPQAALDDEGVKETAAEEQVSQPKPARKVIAPKRRGDDAVPQEEPPTNED